MRTLHDADAKTVNEWLQAGSAVLIDVREPGEHTRENIPGARLVPLSAFDPAALGGDGDKIAVFHCASGNRTRMNAALLLATGYKTIYHLKGGIAAWKAAGLPIRASTGR